MLSAANWHARITELDKLAEQFAEVLAEPHLFWLGAGRRIPGDERLAVKVEALSVRGLNIRRAIIANLADFNNDDLLDTVMKTEDHEPRADALEVALRHRCMAWPGD